jgi:putative oxidoreductase
LSTTSSGALPPRSRVLAWLSSKAAARLAAIALGAVFVAAAVVKIQDPPGFAHEVSNYRLIPPIAVNPVALVLPWLEIFCGLALIFGPGRRAASALVLALLLVFIVGLGVNLARGRPVDCGCFSTAAEVRTPAERLASMRLAIARDIGFLLLAFGSFRAPVRSRKSKGKSADPATVVS